MGTQIAHSSLRNALSAMMICFVTKKPNFTFFFRYSANYDLFYVLKTLKYCNQDRSFHHITIELSTKYDVIFCLFEKVQFLSPSLSGELKAFRLLSSNCYLKSSYLILLITTAVNTDFFRLPVFFSLKFMLSLQLYAWFRCLYL